MEHKKLSRVASCSVATARRNGGGRPAPAGSKQGMPMAGGVVKVYGPAASPYLATVLVCLEEGGAAYELVPVDVAAGENKAPHHLTLNPFGKIPTFQDVELTLFESRAISRHVLRKHRSTGGVDLLREGDPQKAAMVDVWLEVEAHQYGPAIAQIVRHCHCLFLSFLGGGARDQRVVDESAGKLRAVLAAYEARLREHEYLAGGDAVSLADLAHFGFTHYLMATEYAALVDERPAVRAWWHRIAARPAVRKVAAFIPTSL